MVVSTTAGTPPATRGHSTLSTSGAALGNATLAITSGFVPQSGAPNPLAGHPYSPAPRQLPQHHCQDGMTVPSGMSPYKFVANTCSSRPPECQKIVDAVKADAASAVRADATGNFPGVALGIYYLMISTRYNNQVLVWGQPIQLNRYNARSAQRDAHQLRRTNKTNERSVETYHLDNSLLKWMASRYQI
jgi:hypothetical protein